MLETQRVDTLEEAGQVIQGALPVDSNSTCRRVAYAVVALAVMVWVEVVAVTGLGVLME